MLEKVSENDPQRALISLVEGRKFTQEFLEMIKKSNGRIDNVPALIACIYRGYSTSYAKTLMEMPNINVRDSYKGDTVLHYALKCSDPDLELVQAILAKAPDLVSIPDGDGNTPLHCATSKNSPQMEAIVKELVKRNANPNATNHKGQTPKDFALTIGNKEIKKALGIDGNIESSVTETKRESNPFSPRGFTTGQKSGAVVAVAGAAGTAGAAVLFGTKTIALAFSGPLVALMVLMTLIGIAIFFNSRKTEQENVNERSRIEISSLKSPEVELNKFSERQDILDKSRDNMRLGGGGNKVFSYLTGASYDASVKVVFYLMNRCFI